MDVTQRTRLTALSRRMATLLTQKHLVAVALAAIVGLALALRLYGLNWDQGYSFTPHPDERAILMKVGELGTPSIGNFFDVDSSPWNPRWFPYGSFPLYLLKSVQLVYSALPFDELHDLRTAGRTISGLADVGTVVLIYLLGYRLYGRREGLLASVLVATAIIHIQLSHFYAVDTLIVLFTVGSLLLMLDVARTGSLRYSLLVGILIGVGMATKVSQAPIYLAFVTSHFMYLASSINSSSLTIKGSKSGPPLARCYTETFAYRFRKTINGLGIGLVASIITIAVTEPYAFLDWQRFSTDFVEQSEMVRRIRDYVYTLQYVDTPAYWYQLQQLTTWGLGWPLGVVTWAGLLYVALRGMRLAAGLIYLVIGWGLPITLLLHSTDLAFILSASIIAFATLLATLPLRSPESRPGVLVLAWVVPYLLITGAFQVKFLRYLIPVVPFLIMFGAKMIVASLDALTPRWPAIRPLIIAGIVVLVGATAFYGIAFTSIYGQSHPAVRASKWINNHVPADSVILKEHWEESLPNLSRYEVHELPMYDRDDHGKIAHVSNELASASYLVLYSNRLYGTIPRLPNRYPLSSEYYRLLFSGDLGYELAHVETNYPTLAGVTFVEDTLSRPDLPRPNLLTSSRSVLNIDFGFADESFSVYDHPATLIFENVANHDAATIINRIENASEGKGSSEPPLGLMLTSNEAEAQSQGGTWSEIVLPNSWTNKWPVVAWLVLVEGMALLTLPIAFLVLSPLPDKGFLFAKPLGMLLVGLAVWLLASLQWMSFSKTSISVCLVILGATSIVMLMNYRKRIVSFVRKQWPMLLFAELVFLVSFLFFVAIRMANPDLWHPFRGGEKPMDFAYLNAVVRSTYMPPFDPWFSGGTMNYYYWGHFLVAMLVRATGIDTAVAYNLAIPTFFAMTVAGAYSIVYNLAEATRKSTRRLSSQWSPVLSGMIGGVFVAVLGNLDGAFQIAHGAWRVIFNNMPFGDFDFWRSSRMMAPDPPGHEITEFPYFTYLLADLHAHLIALPFTLLTLGIALATLLGAFRVGGRRWWGPWHIARLIVLGITVGALRVLNTWDFPTYALITVAIILVTEQFTHGGWGLSVLFRSILGISLTLSVGFIAFLPYHIRYETFFSSIERTTNTTTLWQFLGIHGLFLFVIGSFCFCVSQMWWLPVLRRTRGWLNNHQWRTSRRVWAAGIAISAAAFVVTVHLTYWLGSTIPVLVMTAGPVAAIGVNTMRRHRTDSAALTFVIMLVLTGFALAVGLDLFRIEGDIDRMNSVFKFYLQIWVFLALAAAYMLWRLGHYRRLPLVRMVWPKWIWTGTLLVLLASAAVYPVLGTRDRLRDRFDGSITALTLDGTTFMERAIYEDQDSLILLSKDLDAIRWLLGTTDGHPNVTGSPTILEAQTPMYRWGNRVSVYTGLPGIVGWGWHQTQQRWGYRPEVDRRLDDVKRIFETTNIQEALAIIRRYNVEYVYLGELERLYYPEAGIAKFEDGLGGALKQVYGNGTVTIYRVGRYQVPQ